MGLRKRMLLMGIGSMVGLSVVLLASAAWQSRSFASYAQNELIASANADLSHLAESAYNMVKCQDESLRETVANNIRVADNYIKSQGGISMSGSQTWQATNQMTKQSIQATIPVMSIGGKSMTGNDRASVRTPVVDDITGMVGGMATVFQRMNKQGDMLRVATNVITDSGNRAVGTYIPAVNPDGKPNPVVSALLDGRNYEGMAYVVGNWCVTTYQPLKDSSGTVIGAIFVGVRQENVPSLRSAITDTKIGKTGYIWVVSGKGETKGQYVISKGSERDGEYLLDLKDADGNFCIKDMMEKGFEQPGKVFLHRYSWKDAGTEESRQKLVAAVYYEPWGWLIGASAYEDEYLAPVEQVKASGWLMLVLLLLIGIVSTLVAGYAFSTFASGIAEKLTTLAGVAKAVAQGDVGTASTMLDQSDGKAA